MSTPNPAGGAPDTTAELWSIQMLRAVAALMVVAHHARHYFPEADGWTALGSRGVDVFFVISGFVMAHSTRNADARVDRIATAKAFLARRLLRVVPLYWLALLWTAKRDVVGGSAGMDFLKDLVFWPHFHAVYHDGIYPVLVPGWTINYEMFFYALFAGTLLLGRSRRWILPLTLCMLAAAGSASLIQDSGSALLVFYTHSVVIEFAAGLLVHALWSRWPQMISMPAAAVVSAVALGLLAIENGDRWRGPLDGIPAAVLVWSCLRWLEPVDLPWLRSLGDASYSIYLFHLASFAVSGWLLKAAGLATPDAVGIGAVIGVHVVIASIAGWGIHRLIERPMLRALRRGRQVLSPAR